MRAVGAMTAERLEPFAVDLVKGSERRNRKPIPPWVGRYPYLCIVSALKQALSRGICQ